MHPGFFGAKHATADRGRSLRGKENLEPHVSESNFRDDPSAFLPQRIGCFSGYNKPAFIRKKKKRAASRDNAGDCANSASLLMLQLLQDQIGASTARDDSTLVLFCFFVPT
jgi:hypothetical protein